MNIESVILIKT